MIHLNNMKYLILSILLVSSVSNTYTINRKTYIMTPQGPVRVVTPQDVKQMQQADKNKLSGVGQEFQTRAEINDKKEVSAFVRGCNKVDLGSQQAAEDASDEEKAQAKKLQSLKNGDAIVLKMDAYGSCSVKDWRKR